MSRPARPLSLIALASFIAVALATIVLLVTALPTLGGSHLAGDRLLIHMMASGVVVAALPVYASVRLMSSMRVRWNSLSQRSALRCLIVFGLLTTATMFACMLPIASTKTMESLIMLHGWFGYAMVVATGWVTVLWMRGRSVQTSK